MTTTIKRPHDHIEEWVGDEEERRIAQDAVSILDRWDGWQSGHPSRCVAAAVIYQAARDRKDVHTPTQRVLSKEFDTTPKTIRNILAKYREQEVA